MAYNSIQKRIFNDYFEQTTELSNLYNWMYTPGTDEFSISETVNKLSNISDFLIAGSSDYDCNIQQDLHSVDNLSNIVKTSSGSSNPVYALEQFDANNANHYIPHFPQALIEKIDSEHRDKLNKIFNIYQLYDHVINNPSDIGSSSTINAYNFIDLVAITLDNTNTTYPTDSYSHYDYIIGSTGNSIKDKLTPSCLYTCRGIYLILLYKNIAEVYISYYNQCDNRMNEIDITRDCSSSAINEINSLIESYLRTAMNKIYLFTNYKLKVTFTDSNTLTLDETGTTSSTFFNTLIEDEHIIYNINKNKYINIEQNITKSSNSYALTDAKIEGNISNNFTIGDKCVILSKKSDYASYTYDEAIDNLSNTNEIFNKNKSEYQKSIGNYNAVQGSFNNIDYLYYLTIIIVIISLIAIIATNSEQSRKTRVFIILVIVLLTYGMIFSFIEVAKRFTENFDSTDETKSKTDILNNNFDMYLGIIYMESSNYGMTRLYDTLTTASNKELSTINKQNTTLLSSINRNDATTNAEWHRLFQRTLFIHTMFLFLIIILTYLWLSIIMPDLSIYLLFVTIIACMLLIFYYFRNLHRVVRTEYKHRYWTKMSV